MLSLAEEKCGIYVIYGDKKEPSCYNKEKGVLPDDPVFEINQHSAEALKDRNDVDRLVSYSLNNGKLRDAMLMVAGFNLGLRIIDLVSMRFKDIYDSDWSVKDSFVFKEQKTGKLRQLFVNDALRMMCDIYIRDAKPASQNDYMFTSNSNHKSYVSGYVKCMNVSTGYRIITSVAKAVGLQCHVSTHTMRKTCAFHMCERESKYKHTSDRSVLIVQHILGHSDVRTTFRYAGFDAEEFKDSYMSLNLGINAIKTYMGGGV